MKLLVISDLHNEFSQFEPALSDADVVILACDSDSDSDSDNDNKAKGVRWANEAFTGISFHQASLLIRRQSGDVFGEMDISLWKPIPVGCWLLLTGFFKMGLKGLFTRCADMSNYFELLQSQQTPTETEPVGVPALVLRAVATNFRVPVTGYLCSAMFDEHLRCLVGIVFRENRGRFRDGATIRTSQLLRIAEHDGYKLFNTIGGSCYVVCDWASEGVSPRFSGVLH